jgi:hypothetical protein
MALAAPIPSQPRGIAEPDSRRPDGRHAIAAVFLGMTMSDKAALRPCAHNWVRYLARFEQPRSALRSISYLLGDLAAADGTKISTATINVVISAYCEISL